MTHPIIKMRIGMIGVSGSDGNFEGGGNKTAAHQDQSMREK